MATVIGVFSQETTAAAEDAGLDVLGSNLQILAKLEKRSGHRSTGDSDSMAPKGIQALLAMEIAEENRPTQNLQRNSLFDSQVVAGKSALGRAAD